MGYDRKTQNFYVVVENFTPYILNLYPHSMRVMELIRSDDPYFENGSYITCSVKDDEGKLLNFPKSNGLLTLARTDMAFVINCNVKRPKIHRTYVCFMGNLPERTRSICFKLHIELFRRETGKGVLYMTDIDKNIPYPPDCSEDFPELSLPGNWETRPTYHIPEYPMPYWIKSLLSDAETTYRMLTIETVQIKK